MKKKKKIWRRGGWSIRTRREERVVLCENEEEWKALYREGRGLRFGHMGRFGWEIDLNFEGRWGFMGKSD